MADTWDWKTLRFDECVEMAKMAEQAERFEDMMMATKLMIEKGEDSIMRTEQRNLLSVAYKNVVGSCRTAWRVLSGVELKAGYTEETVKEYKKKIKSELQNLCMDIINLLDTNIIDKDVYKDDVEAQVFFLKMKGDYYRYMAEVLDADDDQRENVIGNADEAYNKACGIAEKLAADNSIRLGLALNYSVFHFEIKDGVRKACELAKKAFDDAFEDISAEKSTKDSTLILQLLRDNLTLWSEEAKDTQ